jgi:hypothetical protein
MKGVHALSPPLDRGEVVLISGQHSNSMSQTRDNASDSSISIEEQVHEKPNGSIFYDNAERSVWR